MARPLSFVGSMTAAISAARGDVSYELDLVAHRFSDPIGDAACRNGKPDFCKGLANLSRDMVSTILIASDRGQPGTSGARTFESAT
jgi:hypothetical protein